MFSRVETELLERLIMELGFVGPEQADRLNRLEEKEEEAELRSHQMGDESRNIFRTLSPPLYMPE